MSNWTIDKVGMGVPGVLGPKHYAVLKRDLAGTTSVIAGADFAHLTDFPVTAPDISYCQYPQITYDRTYSRWMLITRHPSGLDGTGIWVSTDLATWTEVLIPHGCQPEGKNDSQGCYFTDGHAHLALLNGDPMPNILRSSDGITWTEVYLGPLARYVDWVGGDVSQWMISMRAVSPNDPFQMSSSNQGATWIIQPHTIAGYSGTYVDVPAPVFRLNSWWFGVMLTVESGANRIKLYRSSDGDTWTACRTQPWDPTVSPSSPYMVAMAYNGSKYVAIGADGGVGGASYTSPNGDDWTAHLFGSSGPMSSPINLHWDALKGLWVCISGHYVGGGTSSAYEYFGSTSPDGVIWTSTSLFSGLFTPPPLAIQ